MACATVAGAATLALLWLLLRPAGEVFAALIRRRWPEAWFAGMIVWYADFVVLALSIAIAVILGRYVYKKVAPSTSL